MNRRQFSKVVCALAAATLVVLPAAALPTADAATAADGSGWNSAGTVTSDSPLTLRWDNQGNRAGSVVSRDATQSLSHTAGKTYADVDATVRNAYSSYFGTDNGLGGLEVTVSQTQNLVNQAVTLSFKGAKGGASTPGAQSVAYFQVFQCWGGLKADGTPDLAAANPDPATCQVGASGPDGNPGNRATQRYVGADSLVRNGDWNKYYDNILEDVPFVAISGEVSGSTIARENQFFDSASTNEASDILIGPAGSAVRQFEIQTGFESSGLGCGYRSDAPSTSTCWLVIVPRIQGGLERYGPISPTVWAQRMQVKLSFRDISTGCPGGQSRALLAGSELVTVSAASWIPGVCASSKVALGVTQIGDAVARTQFDGGAQEAILTTQPLDGGVSANYVPVANAASVIAYNIAYTPRCLASPPINDVGAVACGYTDLAELESDWQRAGQPIRGLRLDARLVAKLLTQSYLNTLIVKNDFPAQPWMTGNRPAALMQDPEFRRLNPDLAHMEPSSAAAQSADHAVVELLRSDSAAQVWQWLLADPEAKAFLDGCPDADGLVVNPFYSTRTYAECQSQAAMLAAQADADRAATPTPTTYVDSPLSYPPDGTPYPEPTWQEWVSGGAAPYGVVDQLPPVDNAPIAGRDVAIGYTPRNSDFCATALDPTCQPAPGKWKDPKNRASATTVGVIAITDAATAAKFQLPTAQLCDSAGTHCVGASTASLTKAAAKYVASGTDGVLVPGTADYASGAYPLTMPVYAAVSSTVSSDDAKAYATALTQIVDSGQTPGFEAGDLPPGYAPLTSSQKSAATAAIAKIAAGAPADPDTSTDDSGTSGGIVDDFDVSDGGIVPIGSDLFDDVTAAPMGDPGTLTTGDVTIAGPKLMKAPADDTSWPGKTIPFLVLLTLVAGLVGPLLRLRFRVVVRA